MVRSLSKSQELTLCGSPTEIVVRQHEAPNHVTDALWSNARMHSVGYPLWRT